MRIFELKGSKERVKIGDSIYKKSKDSVTIIRVTNDNVDNLVKKGILVEKKAINLSYNSIKKSIHDRTDIPLDVIENILQGVYNINEAELYSLLLKEISIILNRQYDKSPDCKDVYIISRLDGDIKRLSIEGVNPYSLDNISTFRTGEEAEIARKVVKEIFREHFK